MNGINLLHLLVSVPVTWAALCWQGVLKIRNSRTALIIQINVITSKINPQTNCLWFRALAVFAHGVAALLAALLAGPAIVLGQVVPARALRHRHPLPLVILLHLGEGLELLLDHGAGDGGLLAPGLNLIQDSDEEDRRQQKRLHGEALAVLGPGW